MEPNKKNQSKATPNAADAAPVSEQKDVPMTKPVRKVSPKPVKRRSPAVFVVIVVVMILAWIGIAPRVKSSQKLRDEVEAVKDAQPVVSVVTLKLGAGESDGSLPSNIQAIDQTTINARTSGFVHQRFVDIGSKVKKGDVLAIVESPEVDQQLRETQADEAKSEAGLGQAQADSAKLLAAVSASRSDEQRSEASLAQARADLAHLQAKELQSEAALDVAKAKQREQTKRYAGAKAELNRAKAGLDIARKTLDRWKELERAQAVSGQDVDEKQAAFDSSQAQVEAAEAGVSSVEAEVQAANETIRSARADIQAAKADVTSGQQRVNAARSSVSSSRAGIQAALAGYSASRSNVTAAGASVRSSEANAQRVATIQSFERIVAPFSGVITARNVDVGDLVNPGGSGSGASDQTNAVTRTGLFGLARTDVLRAQVDVPEDMVATIKEGQDADIETQEYPGRVFKGKVFHVSGALDSRSRTLLVEVRIDNPNGTLKPGMYAQVRFLGSSKAALPQIPATALVFDAKGTRVAEVTPGGTVHYVDVKLGRDFGDQIEILSGLRGDETLITNPDDSLQEGEKVKVAESGAK